MNGLMSEMMKCVSSIQKWSSVHILNMNISEISVKPYNSVSNGNPQSGGCH